MERKKFTFRDIISTIIIFILFIFVMWGGQYASSQITQLNAKNKTLQVENTSLVADKRKLVSENETLTQKNKELQSQLDEVTNAQTKADLLAQGIIPDLQTISSISLNSSWQDSSFQFKITRAYLTPEISDLKEARETPRLKDKNYLMLEVEVKDVRQSGSKRSVPISDFLRLSDVLDSSTFTEDYYQISPNETASVYSGFAVDPEETLFTLRSGFTTSPEIIVLDFEGPGVSVLNGVFALQEGFSSEY